MPAARASLALFGVTIFLGAGLLFLVQLIFGRLILPILGGAPAVWNTAMVFYQAVLLGGYAYAHVISSRLRLRTQLAVHAAVLLLPVLVLPIGLPTGWSPPTDGNPALWLLVLMGVAVGLPFFAVSTTSPLLQRWFAQSGHPSAADPYFLYAASNAGSLLGLLAYPFIIEPHTTLAAQGTAWTFGFGLLALGALACGGVALRAQAAGIRAPAPAAPAPTPSWGRRLHWVGCSAVPSSLLLSVTGYLSSDLAAVPLLWVVPLALYLATFILAFSPRGLAATAGLARYLPVLLAPIVMTLATGATTPLLLLVLLHLAGFVVASLVCHSALARGRPDAAHLTEFYLWLSVGGVLGGSLTALLAPVVFNGVAEYPIGLLAAALLGLPPAADGGARARRLDLLAPLALGALAAGLALGVRLLPGEPPPSVTLLAFGIPCILAFLLSARRLRFVLALAAILLAGRYAPAGGATTLLAERSFFGVHRVTRDAEGRHHLLLHGRIVHGMQRLDPAQRAIPLAYYHRGGPLGQVFAALAPGPGAIGVVGLGAGAIAAYGGRSDHLVFYEIDPVVARIAQDRRFFHHLADSEAEVEIVLGDARLSLQRAADGAYRVLVLDAYSSDSIPIHLMTREALRLYLAKLAPGGWLVFHISNLHLDLRPVLETLAHDAGLAGVVRDDAGLTDEELEDGKSASQWLVLARDETALAPLVESGAWERLRARPGRRPWTDDYSSLLEALGPGDQ
jgi:hypothetical protein